MAVGNMLAFSSLKWASFGLMIGLFSSAISPQDLAAQDLKSYIGHYPKTRLIQSNSEALKLRIALLDSAPRGAHVRIATFTFDFGKAVESLSVHMCAAATRGVRVELLADSKSGDRPGLDDAFDESDTTQKTEELYQYMANCGVEIYIHNAGVDYVKFFGTRLPNVFNVPTGTSLDPFKLLFGLKDVKNTLDRAMAPTLTRLGVRTELSDLIGPLQDIAMELRQLKSVSGRDNGDDSFQDPVERSIDLVAWHWRSFLNSDFWNDVDLAKLKKINSAVQHALNEDPALSVLNGKIRAQNRLNHRKLFIVENAAGGDACALVGGRNLGDHYLTDGKDSYYDADVLVCTNHGDEAAKIISEANVSFDRMVPPAPALLAALVLLAALAVPTRPAVPVPLEDLRDPSAPAVRRARYRSKF